MQDLKEPKEAEGVDISVGASVVVYICVDACATVDSDFSVWVFVLVCF